MYPYTEWVRKHKNLHRQNNGAYHAEIAKYMTTGSKAGNKLNGTTMTIVKPDWIIKLKGKPEVRDAIINIEMDMGTEPIETLAQKLFKYAILAEKNPEVLHIMDIVIVDNSLSNRSSFSDGIAVVVNIVVAFDYFSILFLCDSKFVISSALRLLSWWFELKEKAFFQFKPPGNRCIMNTSNFLFPLITHWIEGYFFNRCPIS